MNPKMVTNLHGDRIINIQTTPNSSNWITVALAVTASGKKLTEVVFFRGKPDARVANELKGFQTRYGAFGCYTCQEKAWMDAGLLQL